MGKQTKNIEYVDQKQFDKNLDESLEILINDGADDETINIYIDDYKSRYAVKKKESSQSSSVQPKSGSVPKTGSSGTAKQSFRLPTEKEFEEGQKRGEFAPNRSMPKSKETQYDLEGNTGKVIQKPKEVIGKESDYVLETKEINQKPFEKQTAVNPRFSEEQKAEVKSEISEAKKLSTPEYEEDIYNFTAKDKEQLKSDIDTQITEEDLDNPVPFKFYSTYDKAPVYNPATRTFTEVAKDPFVDSEFGDEKLKEIGIDPADFDGYLNEKGFKKDFLEKEEKGLFEGKGKNLSGADIQLAREIQKQKMFLNYIAEKNERDFKAKNLNAKKENLDRSSTDAIKVARTTIFEPKKVETYLENEFPLLSKKLKERDEESRKILEQHNKGEAGVWYGTKNTLKSGWNGFVDRINNLSATVYDKIGMDETAEEVRMMHEQNQLLKPNTREVGYVSGKSVKYDGVEYLVDENGQIYDKDKKIRVTDLMLQPTYESIVKESQKGKEDWIFSPQGTSMQLGGVLGDMIVQVALTRGVGGVIASPGISQISNLSKLSKIPISKNISSAIIAQSSLGYSQGLEETMKAAKDAGLNDNEADMLANDAAQRMAILYAVTAPISPQTKATEALFGNAEKDLIKKAILSYKEIGKKGFIETLRNGIPKLAKAGTEISEEGLKELFQENIQQAGEALLVNKETNKQAGKEILKDSISVDDFVNTSILSFASGGLITQMKLPTLFKNNNVEQLRTLNTLSQDYTKFEQNLDNLVQNGSVDSESAEKLKKDVKIFGNNKNKIPTDTKPEVALDLMRGLDEISQLEAKKKTLDASFHENIDEQIKSKREEIKSLYNQSNQNAVQQEATTTETKQETQPQAEVQETEQEVLGQSNNNQIKEPSDNNDSQEVDADIPNPNQINNEEYSDFIDKGIVSEERLISIANKVKNQEKLSEKETAIFNDKTSEINEILKNEATPSENIIPDGNSRTGIEPLAEVGKTTEQATENAPTESIPPTSNIGTSETENEVDYVKKEIEKGILNWSGDIGSPRIDLGISWADIRKGEADIRKGNVNTVPAKRLIEAINKAKKEGGYRYKQGTGGKNMKSQEFVTFEDIQRATNEDSLTDAEINEIMTIQDELATEYDEYFNSLDEQTQNEILENYENQPREISEDTQRRESEINVSDEKETAAEPKQEVEKTILDRILNQDELKDTFDFLDSFKIDPNDLKATLPFLPEVWNAFIEAVKLSMKAGNSIRNAMDIAFEKMKQEGSDANELTNVYNLFGKKFTENFVPKETKEFVEAITSDTNPENDSVEFEKMASNFPNTGEVGTYLSGETIEKYMGESPENNQEIFKIKLIDSLKHGVETIQRAIDTFGDKFVSEVLKFAENPTLSIESKTLLLISLENELNRQKIAFPENKADIQKKLNLVRTKRQALARSASLALNMNRLQKFAEVGFDVNEITDKMFSNSEKETRRKIEKAVESNFDDINKAEEESELGEDFEITGPISKRDKAEVKKDISEALKKMKEDLAKVARGGTLNATIPGYKQLEAATPHILKLAKLYAELGGMSTKQIVSEIFSQISSVFPNIQRKDIADVIRDTQEKKEPKKNKKMKDLVKQALINRGYFREVNKKQEDGTRQPVKLLDWKKLAGEEGSVDNIKEKTEEALKEMGYTNSQIESMQKSLLEEYNDLRASIIEKSLNELENRNRIKPSIDKKTLAKKLAELYNFGLFEENMDKYENLLNSAIGFNTFQQKQYEELKEYGKALSILFNFNNGKNKDQKFSELAIKTQAAIITKNIDLILSKATFVEAPKYFKLASIFQNFMGLSQRMKLVSFKQILENPFSAKKNLFYQNMGDLFLVKENGELKANRKKLAKYVYRDIVFNGSNIYGDVTTSLTTQSQVEEWLNKQSDNKLYHSFVSGLLGRSFLEGADSLNKVLMTEKIFQRNLIKLIMTGDTDLGKMTEKEAMDWVSERMTGQNLKDAEQLAEQVIDKVNSDAGKEILPKTKENIFRFASDIVKESLNQGNALDIDLIQKAYNSAYKSAGFNLGHEANNVVSVLAGQGNQFISAKLDRAIRDKKWEEATMLTLANILTKNIINPFVGGGFNWMVLGAQTAGMDPFSVFFDYARYKSNRIDLTSDQGIKNLENAMVRSANIRNTTARTFVGAVISIGMAAAFVASGQGDDLEDWLKQNEWARKYFKVFSPKSILLVLAYENGSLPYTLADLLGQKTDNFDTSLRIIKSVQDDKKSTAGEIGRAIAGPMEVPFVPWRVWKDVDNINRGFNGLPQYKSDYRVTGFFNGVYQGGLVDYIGLRPEGDFKPKDKDSGKIEFPDPSKNLPNPMKGLPNY